jgi:hypothetical protein
MPQRAKEVRVAGEMPASASECIFTFTNTGHRAVNDLFVAYDQPVDNFYYDPFIAVDSLDLAEQTYKYRGTEIGVGESARIKVRAKASGRGAIHVAKWYWTVDCKQEGAENEGDPK